MIHNDRIETQTGYATEEIDWLSGEEDWKKLARVGMAAAEQLPEAPRR